jgi:hypothetical protein
LNHRWRRWLSPSPSLCPTALDYRLDQVETRAGTDPGSALFSRDLASA